MADLSPELAERLQSLEGSYASNPGRYFMALASAWREAGDIARAEEILRENLKRFPGLSAHVLLGRCLAERGAFQEAANEFHYVLSIDSQNLVALPKLAEMALAAGRPAEAEKWYNELLAVDPMNADARAALAQLARTAAAEPAPPSSASFAGPDDGEFGMIDLDAPEASPADASGAAAADEPEPAAWGDLSLDASSLDAASLDAPPPASADDAREPAAPAADFDAFGFGSVDLDAQHDAGLPSAAGAPEWAELDARQDVGESAAPDGLPSPDDDLPSFRDDLPALGGDLPSFDDDALAAAPLAGADLPLLDLGPADDELAAAEPGAGFGFGEPAGDAFDGGHVAHEEDGHDAAAEMVTETMAELYASQGLLAQAADVYRELIAQRGDEPGLTRRLAELEERMNPSASLDAADGVETTPDWLAAMDDFASETDGGTGASADSIGLDAAGGFPELELTPDAAEERLASTGLDAEPSAEADELGLIEPATDTDWATSVFGAADADPAGAEPASIDDYALVEPAPVEDLAAADSADSSEFGGFDAGGFDAGGFDAGESAPAPAGDEAIAAASASPDPFADSFAGGFDGAGADVAEDAAPAPADDGRHAWAAPTVTETEPVGFDLVVVADDEGGELPAPPEVVADMSADWAMAAAPLEDDENEAEAIASIDTFAPAGTSAAPTGTRTMSSYFSSLLTWQPLPAAAAEAPAYEVSADGASITIEPAAESTGATDSVDTSESVDADAAGDEPPPFASAPPSFTGGAPGIPTFDAPGLQTPAFAPEAEAEPWSAPAQDDPWAAPAAEAADEAAADELPLMEMDEPWAAPAAADEPLDVGGFELAEEPASAPAEGEEPLPWEVAAEPAPADAPAAAESGNGFSFEDFFAGAPEAPAAPDEEAQPEPELPAPPAAPSFIPSFAEPTPPPVFEAPAPPAPPAPAAEQDEDDEDLESFQAWLQSLKR